MLRAYQTAGFRKSGKEQAADLASMFCELFLAPEMVEQPAEEPCSISRVKPVATSELGDLVLLDPSTDQLPIALVFEPVGCMTECLVGDRHSVATLLQELREHADAEGVSVDSQPQKSKRFRSRQSHA